MTRDVWPVLQVACDLRLQFSGLSQLSGSIDDGRGTAARTRSLHHIGQDLVPRFRALQGRLGRSVIGRGLHGSQGVDGVVLRVTAHGLSTDSEAVSDPPDGLAGDNGSID
ncbi:MAG: hypothetical protein IH629_07690 [Thermoleophilia bacterium]|nr:hypothetical protein [Thermoleophilia bacterium]